VPSELLSTYPQPPLIHNCRAGDQLVAESIHRLMHRTLTLLPGAGAIRAALVLALGSFAAVDLPAIVAVTVAVLDAHHRRRADLWRTSSQSIMLAWWLSSLVTRR
jgi:hypothetical protein